MQNKLSKFYSKFLSKMIILMVIVGATTIICNNKKTYATDEVEDEGQNGYFTYVYKSNGEIAVNVETKTSNLNLSEGEEITYEINVAKKTKENIASPARLTFKLPEILEFINAEEIQLYAEEIKGNNVEYNKADKTIIWEINTYDGIPKLEIKAKAGNLKSGQYTENIDCKAILTYGNKQIETKNLQGKVGKNNLLIRCETENLNETNEMGDEIKFNIYVENQNDIDCKTNIKMTFPDEMRISQSINTQDFTLSNSQTKIEGKDINVLANETMTYTIVGKINNFEMAEPEKNKILTIIAEFDGEKTSWNVVVQPNNNLDIATKEKITYVIIGIAATIIIAFGIFIIKRKVLIK